MRTAIYKDLSKEKSRRELKKEYQLKYGINAQQFNPIYFSIKRKIESRKECHALQLKQLRERIKDLEKSIKKLERKIDIHCENKRVKLNGIEVIKHNWEYSSLIGLTKYISMYGLSSDTAAALVLAKRALYLSERIPVNYASLVQGDISKLVGRFWNQLSKKLDGIKRHSFFNCSVTTVN